MIFFTVIRFVFSNEQRNKLNDNFVLMICKVTVNCAAPFAQSTNFVTNSGFSISSNVDCLVN